MHILEQIQLPIIFAHRGASSVAPENTIASFDIAFQQNAHAIELDTMLCADGTPVVIHDRTVNRTTNGKGNVDDLTFKQLQNLDAGSWYSKEFAGEKIPSLKTVLSRYGKNHLINIELKNFRSINTNLPEITAEIIENLGISENVLISSFIPRNLTRIRKRNPSLKFALLCSGGLVGKIYLSKLFHTLSPDFIHPKYESLTKGVIKRNHSMGRRIHTWTVDDSAQARSLIVDGVDGIITNYPSKIIGLLGRI